MNYPEQDLLGSSAKEDSPPTTLPERLRRQIIETGEVSPDGNILRFKDLNRRVDTGLLREIADFMAAWIEQKFPSQEFISERTAICVVESSGNILAGFIGERLDLPVIIIKKGKPTTMFGEIISREIHSFTRKTPTTISVEKKDIAGKKLIVVDDFAATGETLGAVEEMAQEANTQIVALCVAISKPTQGSAKIMSQVPSLSVATIEEMKPANDTKPAQIKFTGMDWLPLKRKWGEG